MNYKDISQFQKIVEFIISTEQNVPVAPLINPTDLDKEIDLSLSEEPILDEVFYKKLNALIEKTPKTASSHFFNQLIGGRRSKAVLGDLIASVLNNSMYTYKVAGPMVGVEKTILAKVADLLNYPSSFGGTITNGGSMSNFMALVLARDNYLKDCITEGVYRKMTVYTSDVAHYSIAKNASLAGIGKQQVRFIETDVEGKIIPQKLDAAIEQDLKVGNLPFFINLTSGTTVLGAFDSIEEVLTINSKYNLWIHVDGAFGGATLFSKKYKHLLNGVDKVHSFSVSAHKMLGTPLTCSLFLTSNKQQLFESFASEAKYLYQTQTDDFNPGKTSFQCGRRNDALKLWTLWKSIGTSGMEKMVDHQFYLADIARKYILNHQDYTLYSFPNSVTVCFTYRNIDAERLTKLLQEKSVLLVSYGNYKNQTFIRLVTINSDNTEKDILNFFHLIETFVQQNSTLF